MPDSEWVARQLWRPVVKAFNNIFASSLAEKSAPAAAVARVALPVAADQPDAKAAVLRLVDELGFDPVDAGELGEHSHVADYRAREETRIRESMAAQQARPGLGALHRAI
jgi:predicted dinucleotide-binding enzyme